MKNPFELILKHTILCSPISSIGTKCHSNMDDQQNRCWKLSKCYPLAFTLWQIWQLQFLTAPFIIWEQIWTGIKSPTCLNACGTFQKYFTHPWVHKELKRRVKVLLDFHTNVFLYYCLRNYTCQLAWPLCRNQYGSELYFEGFHQWFSPAILFFFTSQE